MNDNQLVPYTRDVILAMFFFFIGISYFDEEKTPQLHVLVKLLILIFILSEIMNSVQG